MDRIVTEHGRIGSIPLMTMARAGAQKLPVILYVHGFFGRKEDGAELGLHAAQAGFFFAALDGPLHGERYDERLAHAFEPGADKIYPHDSGLDTFFLMLQVIVQTGSDLDSLIDAFANDPRADTSRVGVTGLSYGGMATFYAAAFLPRVRAAVAMIAQPSFTERWRDVVLEASSFARWSDHMAAAREESSRREAWLRTVDPAANLSRFAPRPLLMQCGDLDTDMPKFYTVHALRDLQPLYAQCPERLKLTIYDGVAHRVTGEMMRENIDWFQRYLE